MPHTILFLAANPLGTDRLALDREAQAIQRELERSGHRDSFELETRWAVQPLDLLRELRKLKPTIVHFSGHGSATAVASAGSTGPYRDFGGAHDPVTPSAQHGLYFQGPDGRAQFVSSDALEATFGAAGASVKLVVLSACYSEPQAAALLTHVDCVVGMRGAFRDDAARSFAIGFYGGLGERESVDAAFRQGRAAIGLEGLPDAERPQLSTRPGIDASQLVLAASSHATGADIRPREREPAAAAPHETGQTAVPRNELLDRLSRLLPAQFETVLFHAGVPLAHVSSSSAPQAVRAMEVIRYAEQQDRLAQLARIVQQVAFGAR